MTDMTMSTRESAFALDLNIKAFKGKGDFRDLMKQHVSILQSVHAEMQALENELRDFGLPMLLIMTLDDKTSPYVQRGRLRWRRRGFASHASYERIVKPLFDKVPATLHDYIERCNARVLELNALEAVYRYAACQIGSFLEHGSVKISNRAAPGEQHAA